MKLARWTGLLLLALVLAACGTVEPVEAETTSYQDNIVVSPQTLELEAKVGESVEASFTYLNASDNITDTVFVGTFALNWLEITGGNAQTVTPGETGEVTLRATCDEQQLGFVEDNELFTIVRVFLGGSPNIRGFEFAPEVALRCT